MSNRINALAREIPFAAKRKTTSAEEKKLAKELANVLNRPPRRRGHRVRQWDHFDDEEDLATSKPRQRGPAHPARLTPPPLPASATTNEEAQPQSENSGSEVPDRKLGAVWTPKRRYPVLKQAASWFVSLFIGGLIITVVAVILLGVPNDLAPKAWFEAKAPNHAKFAPPAPTQVTNPTKIRP